MIIFLIFFLFISDVYADTGRFEVKFSDCVDGDTFKVIIDDEKYSVRMLAIDTPEISKSDTESYGKEASDYTCDKVSNAKKLELEYDPGSDKTDIYDRLLAWVYVDDSLIQSELISLGYAKVAYIYDEYKYTEDLYQLEDTASSNKIGLWSEEQLSSTTNETEETTFMNDLQNLIEEYIKSWIKELINDLINYINKVIKSVFN